MKNEKKKTVVTVVNPAPPTLVSELKDWKRHRAPLGFDTELLDRAIVALEHYEKSTPENDEIVLRMPRKVAEVVTASLRALGPLDETDPARQLGDEAFFALRAADVDDAQYYATPMPKRGGALAFTLTKRGYQ